MWDVIELIPDHCLSISFGVFGIICRYKHYAVILKKKYHASRLTLTNFDKSCRFNFLSLKVSFICSFFLFLQNNETYVWLASVVVHSIVINCMQYFNNNNEFSIFLGKRVVINIPTFQFSAVDYLQPLPPTHLPPHPQPTPEVRNVDAT